MKNAMYNNSHNDLQYVPTGKKRFNYHSDFRKKDTIIRTLEIIVALIVIFIAGVGMYKFL